jgi:hypothetical protein
MNSLHPKLNNFMPTCLCLVNPHQLNPQVPNTEAEWTEIANEFQSKWNYPNCIGAIDGKHIKLNCPRNTGSTYFNYTKGFSIVLMALADANYMFRYVDVGQFGRVSDGGVFNSCSLSKALRDNELNIPGPRKVGEHPTALPFVMVADNAFPLKTYIMKPFPFRGLSKDRRIHNYRLSRARRVVENAFGLVSNKFRILLQRMALEPDKAAKVVLACCALHNMLRKESSSGYSPPGYLDRVQADGKLVLGDWRSSEVKELDSIREAHNNYTVDAKATRLRFLEYFNGVGKVGWQDNLFTKDSGVASKKRKI